MRSIHQGNRPSVRMSLSDRVLAALLFPLFFNLALIIYAVVVSRRARMLASLIYVYTMTGRGSILFVVLPAVVGFIAGSAGTAKLLGHAFWTHTAAERNIACTLAVWAFFGGCLYLALGGV